jgi:hypothetical protein
MKTDTSIILAVDIKFVTSIEGKVGMELEIKSKMMKLESSIFSTVRRETMMV